jgi:DNA repair exonuclease SbcCD ATPase subunit
MKKTKTEIAQIRAISSQIRDAIHDILVREHSTNTKLESQIEDLNDEVINLIKSDAVKDDQIDDHERRIKTVDDRRIEAVVRADKQEEIIGRLLTDMSTLATDYMDLTRNLKLGDMDTTVASLVADKDALISHNKCLSKKENELQAQVDELQAQVDDQFEAIGRLSTGMENVAKALTDLDGWLDSVEVVLSALRKST